MNKLIELLQFECKGTNIFRDLGENSEKYSYIF